MAVYKEIGYLAREIKARSRQIWNDAADYGVPVASYDEPLVKQIAGIMKMYGIKPKTHRYSTGATQTFEFSGGYPAVLEAGFEHCRISFVTATRSIKGYITVETWSSKQAIAKAKSIDY